MAPTIRVDVVSDVVCPWCYIGKRRLEAAIRGLPDVDVTVHWRPYRLDPTIPPEGYPRRWYMERKFGSSDRVDEVFAHVTDEAAGEGIAFDLDAIKIASNTLNAHRLIHWAGPAGVQDAVKEACLRAFFCEGKDVGDTDVLVEIAEACRMDGAAIRTMLDSDEDRAQIESEIDEARRMGVTGVPCFIFDRQMAMVGAQPAEAIAGAIRDLADVA